MEPAYKLRPVPVIQLRGQQAQEADAAGKRAARPSGAVKPAAQPPHGLHQLGVFSALRVKGQLHHNLRAVKPLARKLHDSVKRVHAFPSASKN